MLVRASNDVLDVAQGPPVGVGHLWPKLDALHGSTLVVVFRSQILHRRGTTVARKSNRMGIRIEATRTGCCHDPKHPRARESHGSAKGESFRFEYLVTLHRIAGQKQRREFGR